MATSSKRAYLIPRSAAPRAPAPAAGHCWPIPLQETLKQFWLSLCGVRGSAVWALWASLVGIGFNSKHDFAPSTILLGLLLCPWMWGISSLLLQGHAAATPLKLIKTENTIFIREQDGILGKNCISLQVVPQKTCPFTVKTCCSNAGVYRLFLQRTRYQMF